MLGQVGKYSEIINNGLRKYNLCVETFILCAEIFIMCVETFSTPENIFFSPKKKIKCPNIFSPLPRFTFGSPFNLKSAPKTYCWSPKIFCVPQKNLHTSEFFVTCPVFLKKYARIFFFPCRDAVWCQTWVNDPSALLRHSQRCFNCPKVRLVHQVVQCPTWWHTYEYLTGEDQTRTLARRLWWTVKERFKSWWVGWRICSWQWVALQLWKC